MFAVGGGECSATTSERLVVLECLPTTLQVLFGLILDDGQTGVRRVSAVKLIDGLAGESPASADYPVGTVVISGDGAGDQTVGSPDVNVLDGWTQVWSAPTGGQAKQQVVAQANRS